MKNIIVFGTGAIANYLVSNIKPGVNVLAFMETNPTEDREILGKPVISLKDFHNWEYDYVVVAFGKSILGIQQLVEMGVDKEKIVAYSYTDNRVCFSELQRELVQMVDRRINYDKICTLFNVSPKNYYVCTVNNPNHQLDIQYDFVREHTLELIVQEIKRKNVEGDMAELGVFRGEFSSKMNALLPEKRLYLFDTFEGFPAEDITAEKDYILDKLPCNEFANTSVELVLDKMKKKKSCVIKKGYFPDTFDLNDSQFCLVSLDVDLYEGIKAGLEVFWPRLSQGGYIMVHDYNNLEYQGTKEAVMEYCDNNGVSYVPLADIAGTIVITK